MIFVVRRFERYVLDLYLNASLVILMDYYNNFDINHNQNTFDIYNVYQELDVHCNDGW